MSKATEFIRRLLQLRVFLMANLVILFFLSLSFGREWMRNASLQSQIDDLQKTKESLEGRNGELLSLGSTIQSQYFLEQEGRSKYGLRKPGEELVIVTNGQTPLPAEGGGPSSTPSSPAGEPQTPAAADTASTSPSNAARWWDFFFDHQAFKALKQPYDR